MLVIHTEFVQTFLEVWPRTPKIKKIFISGENKDDVGKSLSGITEKAPKKFTSIDHNLNDLLNIQYTSGTTGFPKGCILTHEYWLTIGMNASLRSNITEGDVFLSVAPFYYMDPQWELIMCLITGCSMVLARKYSASSYMKLVHKYNVTVSWATMPIWIFKQPESPYDKDHKMWRVIVGSGFPPHIHKKFEERFNVIARQAYGMTEIGSALFVRLEDDHMTGSGTVGKPSNFREVRIVDNNGNDVLQGKFGELVVKGPGMFKGYYKKPKETAEAFDGEWFRTGDLFRQDENGYYYIVGRKKDMIRRSGENISASEVENVLTSHPEILSAAVVPVKDESRGEEVKAYIVPTRGETSESIPPEEIIAYCLNRIAEFKVPRYIEYKKELPRTPTGKIQKHELVAKKESLTTGCFDRLASR
jgi:crotonobetaine/carnitine-CoA ligase